MAFAYKYHFHDGWVQIVYLIQNLDKLTCEDILTSNLKSKNNIEIITNSTVKKIIGEDTLKSIIINNNGNEEEIVLDGMFISIGLTPQSEFVKDLLKTNKYGYIESTNCLTDIDGIFVAGDCRDKAFRQVTISTSDCYPTVLCTC